MRISQIIDLLDATILTGRLYEDKEIDFAFSSDMMSDVLAYANKRMLLITGLTNPQAVRTAEMLDIECVLYVRAKSPSEQVIELAKDLGIIVLGTKQTMFNTCGILYESGLRGGTRHDGC